MAANKPNVPFSKAPLLHAAQTEASLLERSYPQIAPIPQQDNVQPTTSPQPTVASSLSPTPTAEPIYTPSPSPESTQPVVDHSAAISWAQSNPDDPRAQVILSRAQAAQPTPQDEEQ